MRHLRCAVLTVGLVSLCSIDTPAQTPRVLDSLFAAMHAADGPGCVIAFDSAGQRRWSTSFGVRDLERGGPIDTRTVFEAGSVSKQFAAAAVVLLARDGALSLEDDIRRWIPELPDLGGTTVRELLTHQSGWRDWRDLVEMTRWPSGTAAYGMDDLLLLLSRQRALNFPSGTEYGYSNTNYVLAAILVQRVTGESLRAYTRRVMFTPLGMHDTRWRDSLSEVVPGRALAWSPAGAGRFRLDMPFETVVGPSGLLTTVPDLMKWLRNFDTEAVGGAGFTADMERVGVLRSGRATTYAMGLEVETLHGERLVSHAGWTGGYVAWAGRLPRRALALGILCNGSAVNTQELGPQLMARLAGLTPQARQTRSASVESVAPVSTVPPVSPVSPGSPVSPVSPGSPGTPGTSAAPAGLASPVDEYAGWYRNEDTRAVIELRHQRDRLVAWREGVLHDELVTLSRDRFRVPSQGWVITVRRGEDDQVAGFDLALPRTRRLPFERVPSDSVRVR
jgi:CubicO group peptidase (beta-lactamase class C family)